jgi:prepilin-type N-terminal cleavage/methylation domain-containing protein
MYSREVNPVRCHRATASRVRRAPWLGRGARHCRAFTLIEILIVVVILGILATIVVPQFSNASVTAKENALKDQLRYLRTQIIVYRAQHRDCPPGFPNGDRSQAPSGAAFIDQMTRPTDEDGAVGASSSTVYKYGPYLGQMPANPLTGLTAVQVVPETDPMPDPSGTEYGWIYKPLTGEIIANSTGSDSSGNAYKNY